MTEMTLFNFVKSFNVKDNQWINRGINGIHSFPYINVLAFANMEVTITSSPQGQKAPQNRYYRNSHTCLGSYYAMSAD